MFISIIDALLMRLDECSSVLLILTNYSVVALYRSVLQLVTKIDCFCSVVVFLTSFNISCVGKNVVGIH